MKQLRILAIVLLTLLTSCAHTTTPQNTDPTNLSDLQNMSVTIRPGEEGGKIGDVGQIRSKAIEDTALSLGAQGGLFWASQAMNDRLNKDKWYFETIYNFNGMMLSHGVLPPVLVEGDNTLNLADPSTLRISDKTYQIVAQARFATTAPNWRDYLWMHFTKPELPNKVLLPSTPEERKLWAKNIKIGWDKGIQQSFSIFQQNLARLKRDYNGMILYRKLLQQKMVSPPYVSKTELGVTGDGSDMHVNDQVLRITVLPKLRTDSENWRAVAVKDYDNG